MPATVHDFQRNHWDTVIPCYDVKVLERLLGNPRPADMALLLGVNRSTVDDYRRRRWLSYIVADRVAVAAGYSPHEVWGLDFSDETAALFTRIRTEREELLAS